MIYEGSIDRLTALELAAGWVFATFSDIKPASNTGRSVYFSWGFLFFYYWVIAIYHCMPFLELNIKTRGLLMDEWHMEAAKREFAIKKLTYRTDYYNLICMKATTLYDFMRVIDYINTNMIDFYSGHHEQ